jgi:hypothetical protein
MQSRVVYLHVLLVVCASEDTLIAQSVISSVLLTMQATVFAVIRILCHQAPSER